MHIFHLPGRPQDPTKQKECNCCQVPPPGQGASQTLVISPPDTSRPTANCIRPTLRIPTVIHFSLVVNVTLLMSALHICSTKRCVQEITISPKFFLAIYI